MGAVCGKEDHFESLGSGKTLGLSRTQTPHEPRRKPQPKPQPKPQTLGGNTPDGTSSNGGASGSAGATPDREAMLRAAEARSRAAGSRGTGKDSSLSKKLEQQKKDGGRKEEAKLEAERRGNEPLVWD
ncbi:hypothetical protein JCM3765_002689 [Sporobolomyces pararoseus]